MRQAILRQLRLMLAILLGYLIHVTVMPYLRVGDMSASMLITMMAIVTVGYGLLRGFWVGMIYGILMETMLPTVSMLNLLFYPVSAMLCGVLFADKSETRLQFERSTGRRGRNTSPLVRTVLCAALNIALYEIVNLVYMYLSGATLTEALLWRAVGDIFATAGLTALIMVPVRKLMGFRKAAEVQRVELRFDHRPARD